MTIRVLVVDDHALVRSGLRAVLDAQPGIDVVGEAADGAAAVSQSRALEPDVVLMDISMPKVDGVEATRLLLRGTPPPRVLVLTTFASDEHVSLALEAGASGFLHKGAGREEISSAVRTVAAGGTVLSRDVMAKLLSRSRGGRTIAYPGVQEKLNTLTDSERDVLALLGRGLTNQQIAEELHLSVTSVKAYVSRLLSRLDLDNRTQAAILAHELGLTAQ
ncbi:response regulator transcription factor [Streptomyces sp. 135]|uniref:response regulator transcription factor n=1 Tax=Streptomyces sp. 135 TaxID=2838850 RepID=UPI001CBDCB87|nr:response regulator transcription factor [Streptomyces sp. 135]